MGPMGAVNFPLTSPRALCTPNTGVVVTLQNVPLHFTDDPSKAGSVLVTILVLFRNTLVSFRFWNGVVHAHGSAGAMSETVTVLIVLVY